MTRYTTCIENIRRIMMVVSAIDSSGTKTIYQPHGIIEKNDVQPRVISHSNELMGLIDSLPNLEKTGNYLNRLRNEYGILTQGIEVMRKNENLKFPRDEAVRINAEFKKRADTDEEMSAINAGLYSYRCKELNQPFYDDAKRALLNNRNQLFDKGQLPEYFRNKVVKFFAYNMVLASSLNQAKKLSEEKLVFWGGIQRMTLAAFFPSSGVVSKGKDINDSLKDRIRYDKNTGLIEITNKTVENPINHEEILVLKRCFVSSDFKELDRVIENSRLPNKIYELAKIYDQNNQAFNRIIKNAPVQ